MRVIFDTNIYISYLLTRSRTSAITTIVEAALAGSFILLVPEDLLPELLYRTSNKTYLKERISAEDVEDFVQVMFEFFDIIPKIHDGIPAIVRDRKDDYLLAYSVVGQADYLVTGDDDLLVLHNVDRLIIIKPADFARLIKR